jgi:hypothetical protein
MHVLNFEGNQLAQITSFIDPTLPGYFDLHKLGNNLYYPLMGTPERLK